MIAMRSCCAEFAASIMTMKTIASMSWPEAASVMLDDLSFAARSSRCFYFAFDEFPELRRQVNVHACDLHREPCRRDQGENSTLEQQRLAKYWEIIADNL